MRDRSLTHWLRAIVALALLLYGALMAPDAHADTKTYTVTTPLDSSATPCEPAACSLRAAIIAANAHAGPAIINVPAQIYTLTLGGAGEDQSVQGDLDISGNVTIVGADAATTVVQGDHAWADRIVQIRPGALVSISGVTIKGGRSGGAPGGVIYNQGALMLVRSAVVGGATDVDGGGIANDGALTLIGSLVSGNTAGGRGGGVNNTGTLALTSTTLSGNTAARGGGVANAGGASLNGVTASTNRATGGSGGALLNSAGATTALRNSLLAGNTGAAAPDCAGAFASQGHNLVGKVKGCTLSTGEGDLLNITPQLGPLRNNGGPTPTHALLPGSPALDAGDPGQPGRGGTTCHMTDQRGIQRPQTGRCDIGAFEAVGITMTDFAFQPSNLIIDAGTIVRWKNLDAVAHTTRSDPGPGDQWTSSELQSGDVYSYRFVNPNSAGTRYTYLCSIHPDMTGTILVIGQATQREPVLVRLAPSAAAAGSGPLTLTLTGLDIAEGAKVFWNGVELQIVAISPPDQIQVRVPAELLVAPGEVSLSIVNPDNLRSNSLPFTIGGDQTMLYLPLAVR